MNKKIIILSGGFDPVHKGHVRMFKAASEYGDVVVGANSDDWLIRKKGKPFMPINERLAIVRELRVVDLAFAFNDVRLFVGFLAIIPLMILFELKNYKSEFK